VNNVLVALTAPGVAVPGLQQQAKDCANSSCLAGAVVLCPVLRHTGLHRLQWQAVSGCIGRAPCTHHQGYNVSLDLLLRCASARSMALGHRVKSVSMGKFTSEEVAQLEEKGNEVGEGSRKISSHCCEPTSGLMTAITILQ
jgi:hypothetical protein